jgi:hypothetical protein
MKKQRKSIESELLARAEKTLADLKSPTKSHIYAAGWESFSPDPGAREEMRCRVCGEKMEVKRNQIGPTSSVMAMAGKGREHDSFRCAHAPEKWHKQVLALRQLHEDTPSSQIANLIAGEIKQILETRRPTKDQWDPW